MATPSKLAQARIERNLTQAEVAEDVGVDIATVCRWEKGLHQPYPRHIVKLCTLFETSARELGLVSLELERTFSLSLSVARPKDDSVFARYFQRDIELRLQHCLYDWLHHTRPCGASCALLQHQLNQELEGNTSMNEQPRQNHEGMDIARREALRRLALLPIYALSLGTLSITPTWAPDDILPHCAAGITACEHLSKGLSEDISIAYGVLSTYVTSLKEIVDQSSLHRKEASRLVAQALLIKATLSLHREGPKRALSYGKQAEIYSKESGHASLQLAILRRLAWMYACDKQDKQALDTALKAQSLLQKQQKRGVPVHASIQSGIHGAMAKYQARGGFDEEALAAIHHAKQVFFTSASPQEDAATNATDFNYSRLLQEDGLTSYYLGQYEQAFATFAQIVDPETLHPKASLSSERVRVEIINHQTLASLKSSKKEMDLSIRLWKAGIQGAIDLHSEQRLSEALTAYDIMQALWPGEKRIKALRDFTRHW